MWLQGEKKGIIFIEHAQLSTRVFMDATLWQVYVRSVWTACGEVQINNNLLTPVNILRDSV